MARALIQSGAAKRAASALLSARVTLPFALRRAVAAARFERQQPRRDAHVHAHAAPDAQECRSSATRATRCRRLDFSPPLFFAIIDFILHSADAAAITLTLPCCCRHTLIFDADVAASAICCHAERTMLMAFRCH